MSWINWLSTLAVLREASGGRVCVLKPDHLIGRSGSCELSLDESYVSSRHALLRWTGDGWELRDLGSHNGTFLNGSRLRAGEPTPLKPGCKLAFGQLEQAWLLDNSDPPRPMIVREDGFTHELFPGEIIGLPSPDEPIATVYGCADGRWVLERADEPISPLGNGENFDVHGQSFRFSCPDVTLPTATAEHTPLALEEARLRFDVSRDEEHVQLTAQIGTRSFDLGSRAHNYLLLTLARLRLEDRARSLPETSCGWVYQDELSQQLDMTASQMNIEVFRIRKQLAALNVPAPTTIIERRARTRQLRIGVGELDIKQL